MNPLNDLHELEAAEARRRAEYEQRHAKLVRDASRSLGKARLSKSAGTSPVLAPAGHPLGVTFRPDDAQLSLIHPHDNSDSLCSRESGVAGIPLPPSCHHEDCHKSYRKALKAYRRYSGPSLPPVPPFSLDMASNPTSTVGNLPIAYHSGAARTHLQSRPGSPSHLHIYSLYSRSSAEKEREPHGVADSSSPLGGSSSSSLSESMFSTPIHGISSQLGVSNERSTSGPVTQAQYTPSASPFLRPLQSLGLGSPSVSPKMGQNALGMLAPSDPHAGETSFLDAAGVRTHEPVLGKRRDSSTTVTRHDFSRAHLRAVLPQIKSESTPTSPTWRYFHKPPHSSSVSPPPTVDASPSPPSPDFHFQSLPHTPYYQVRGHPPHHHHLAHSVRMAFAMTPISHLDPGGVHTAQPHPYSQLSSPRHPSMSSSSSSIHTLFNPPGSGSHLPFSHPPSRAGSPPIMLPPLSSSTPNSTATASSRAPSPMGYITLPPLKTSLGTKSMSADDGLEEAQGLATDSLLMKGVTGSHSTPGERITLPGFSEIIRAADS